LWILQLRLKSAFVRELFILIAHLLVTLAKLVRPGGLGRGGGRIAGGQTPVARHEAREAPCAPSDPMGSAGAGSLCAFGVAQTPEQDGGDTEGFYSSALSPRFGEAQV
jgi:hypothetical protein